MQQIARPNEGEYKPYTIAYIDLVPNDGLVLQHLQTNLQIVKDFVLGLPSARLTTPHAPGEWTVQEVLVHIIDTERIFCYRSLCFARNDATELPGFEQDDYVPYSRANDRDITDILDEYSTVRQATLSLFKSFDDEALRRAGSANGHLLSVRAGAYIIAGHELHHLYSMQENYG